MRLLTAAALLCALPAGAVEKAAPSLLPPEIAVPASPSLSAVPESLTGPVAPLAAPAAAVPFVFQVGPVDTPPALPAAPAAVQAQPAQQPAHPLQAAVQAAAANAQRPSVSAESASAAARALFDNARLPADAGPLGALTGATLTPVAKNVYHLNFPTQHLLAATFLRLQEHYESPKFRGKSFTWETFMDWYAKENGKFSYLEDWSGFNIPSRVFRAFRRGDFDPLTKKEAALVELFRKVKGRFYVIGTAGTKDDGTLRHEISHGLYYRDLVYKRRVRALLKTVDLRPMYALLTKLGYGKNVLEDEAHAYLGEDLEWLASKGLDVEPYREVHAALRALYDERAGVPPEAAAAPAEPEEEPAKTPLEAAQRALYKISGGSLDSGDVRAAKLSLAQRTAYFRSPQFKAWVASEKAAGRQVFWLKDIDKTQASGDVFTYFFKWRADHDAFLPEQNEIMRSYLTSVGAAPAASAPENARKIIALWRAKENGGQGIGLLDFWKVYWQTQQGLTKQEKLRQVEAFAREYGPKVYPGVPDDNRALAQAGVEAVAVSNGDQELALAIAPHLGLKTENVVGSHLMYGPDGRALGVNHAYEIFDKEWGERPQPGKDLTFHYWVHENRARWGWKELDASKVVIAGADGDSASTDGGMWHYFKDKPIGNFMIDTPHEPDRILKSQAMMAKYGWTPGQHFTLAQDPASAKAWDDGAR